MQVTKSYVIGEIRAAQGQQSLRQFAIALDVSAAYLSDVYSGKRDIGPKLLDRFGFRKRKRSMITYYKTDEAKEEA